MHRSKQALVKSLTGKRAAGEKRVDSFPRNAPVGEGGTRSFSGHMRRCRAAGGRPAEAWRGGGLEDVVDVDEGATCDVVRMMWRLRHGENRREAGVGSFEQRAPFVPGACLKKPFEFAAQLRSVIVRVGQTEELEKHLAELELDRCDRHETAVRAFIRFVDRGAGIEQVGSPLQSVQTRSRKAIKARH